MKLHVGRVDILVFVTDIVEVLLDKTDTLLAVDAAASRETVLTGGVVIR